MALKNRVLENWLHFKIVKLFFGLKFAPLYPIIDFCPDTSEVNSYDQLALIFEKEKALTTEIGTN